MSIKVTPLPKGKVVRERIVLVEDRYETHTFGYTPCFECGAELRIPEKEYTEPLTHFIVRYARCNCGAEYRVSSCHEVEGSGHVYGQGPTKYLCGARIEITKTVAESKFNDLVYNAFSGIHKFGGILTSDAARDLISGIYSGFAEYMAERGVML